MRKNLLQEMTKQQEIFFEFLRFCIGNTSQPTSLKEVDWDVQFAIAKKQALVGVLFHGIQQLPKELAPSTDLLMQWIGYAKRIHNQNTRLFVDSFKVAEKFAKEGFRSCILKGQGNALLYPDPYMRTAGDIDIYIEGGRKKVMRYVEGICPGQTMRYHHVDFPVMKTPLEVHFTPSYMYNPIQNYRLQRWFKRMMDLQCSNIVALPEENASIPVPTISFNVVYLLSHLYRHVFSEGIGLRQLLDYYFVLIQNEKQGNDIDVIRRDIIQLGMEKFARGIMWLMEEVFRLPHSAMLFKPDEQQGRFLLNEIMIGGNFGQYDTRLGNKQGEGIWHRYWRMSIRNMRFVRYYPSEALSEPLFRTWWAIRSRLYRKH